MRAAAKRAQVLMPQVLSFPSKDLLPHIPLANTLQDRTWQRHATLPTNADLAGHQIIPDHAQNSE